MVKLSGVLHHYEWNPPDFTDSPTLLFNVAAIRLALQAFPENIASEGPPYSDGLMGITIAHDITYEHIRHIPLDKIQPSLIGYMALPTKVTGEIKEYTIMLDGHHSAARCMAENLPVRLEIVPAWLMHAMANRSMDEMMSVPLLVLEK